MNNFLLIATAFILVTVYALHQPSTTNPQPIDHIILNKHTLPNIATGDGLVGFGKILQMLPTESTRTRIIRSFQNGKLAEQSNTTGNVPAANI